MNHIKQVKPTNKNYFQGYYIPNNPNKYIGNIKEIIFRSSYEKKFMVYCDKSTHIIEWSSEPIGIPYISPLDGKQHKYYIDFWVKIKNNEDKMIQYLVEVKPKAQLVKPIYEGTYMKESKLKNYNKSLKMYITNMAKFKYAQLFAEEKGLKFMVITEAHLGIK